MNAVNRLLVILLALAVIAAAVIVFLVAAEIARPSDVMPGGWVRDQLREIDQLGGGRKAASIGAVVAAAVVAVFLLILEALPLWRVEKLAVADIGGKGFHIYADSIKQLIEQAGRQTDGVKAVSSELRDTQQGLRISCEATLDSSANMPEAGSELQTRAKAAVESMAGVSVAEVRVKLRYEGPPPEQRVS